MTERAVTNSLEQFRERFLIADPELVYLDGNSLGRLPLATIERLKNIVEDQWGKGLIRSWNEHWLEMVRRVRGKLAHLLHAEQEEVLVADSTSINLYKLVHAFLDSEKGAFEILTDSANFPSDLYVLQGLCDRTAGRVKLRIPSEENSVATNHTSMLLEQMNGNTRLIVLSHVHYQSGFAYGIREVEDRARQVGATVLWDVSHSVGAMPIDVKAMGCQMLVGCCYKYLNGGPGAPAFLYVQKDLQTRLENPIQGWFGAAKPFEFSSQYEQHPDIERFAVGTPSILSLAAIEPGLDLTLEAGIDNIRRRSVELTEQFIEALDAMPSDWNLRVVTPRTAFQRGSHVSVQHPQAWQITQALIHEYKVIPDYREPNMIRFGFTPLYNSSAEVKLATDAMRDILSQNVYLRYKADKVGVT